MENDKAKPIEAEIGNLATDCFLVEEGYIYKIIAYLAISSWNVSCTGLC